MALANLFRSITTKAGPRDQKGTPAEEFIRQRRANMAHLSEQDIERIADEALANENVDPEEILREMTALRERVEQQQRRDSARSLGQTGGTE